MDAKNNGGREMATKILWWLLGAFFAISTSVCGAWLWSMQSTIEDVRMEQLNRTTRIASLEQSQTDVLRRLERMETKLDKLLEGRK